jgi:hypothetical protein
MEQKKEQPEQLEVLTDTEARIREAKIADVRAEIAERMIQGKDYDAKMKQYLAMGKYTLER